MGDTTEDVVPSTAQVTIRRLGAIVRVEPGEVILENWYGSGRVGLAVPPQCRRWIRCDVSRTMLELVQQRRIDCDHAEFVEISGFDLKQIPNASRYKDF